MFVTELRTNDGQRRQEVTVADGVTGVFVDEARSLPLGIVQEVAARCKGRR